MKQFGLVLIWVFDERERRRVRRLERERKRRGEKKLKRQRRGEERERNPKERMEKTNHHYTQSDGSWWLRPLDPDP